MIVATDSEKTGILLVNLGTPSGTDYWSVRTYLAEFLADPRVIETPRVLWWFILNLVILNFRPQKSAKAYRKIWDLTRDESPLLGFSRDQATELQKSFGDVVVDFAMRYGSPSIEERLTGLKEQGCTRILLFPLYPQYSSSTTASVNDKAFDVLKKMRWQPALRTVPAYPTQPDYIAALAGSVRSGLAKLDFEPEMILTSFHGLPQSYVEKGDPYYDQCLATGVALGAALGLGEDRYRVVFQSRFGRAQWLQPYLDNTLVCLAEQGIKRIAILSPGFVSDCIETLEEIAMEGRETFLEAGGSDFAYIPCLNASEEGVSVIEKVVRTELGGWL